MYSRPILCLTVFSVLAGSAVWAGTNTPFPMGTEVSVTTSAGTDTLI